MLMIVFLNQKSAKTSALKKIAALLFVATAIIFILNPSLADEIAHSIGIGRGADLIFYGLVFVVIFQTISMSVYKREQIKRENKIIRELSLLKKEVNDQSKRRH
jgi:hypothetical protein